MPEKEEGESLQRGQNLYMNRASQIIRQLGLMPHPEGGYFREIYRSGEMIPRTGLPDRFPGDRSFSTAIYYLLEAGHVSRFHRIPSDELWHFYEGDPLAIHILEENRSSGAPGPSAYTKLVIGKTKDFVAVVPAGVWFAAEPLPEHEEDDCPEKRIHFGYCLVGCTVSPGFDFMDFETGETDTLKKAFPGHIPLVERLGFPGAKGKTPSS